MTQFVFRFARFHDETLFTVKLEDKYTSMIHIICQLSRSTQPSKISWFQPIKNLLFRTYKWLFSGRNRHTEISVVLIYPNWMSSPIFGPVINHFKVNQYYQIFGYVLLVNFKIIWEEVQKTLLFRPGAVRSVMLLARTEVRCSQLREKAATFFGRILNQVSWMKFQLLNRGAKATLEPSDIFVCRNMRKLHLVLHIRELQIRQ